MRHREIYHVWKSTKITVTSCFPVSIFTTSTNPRSWIASALRAHASKSQKYPNKLRSSCAVKSREQNCGMRQSEGSRNRECEQVHKYSSKDKKKQTMWNLQKRRSSLFTTEAPIQNDSNQRQIRWKKKAPYMDGISTRNQHSARRLNWSLHSGAIDARKKAQSDSA